MELRYIVLLIIKILISIPTSVLLTSEVQGGGLMGGHLNNSSNATRNFDIDNRTLETSTKLPYSVNSSNLSYEDLGQYDEYYEGSVERVDHTEPNASPLVLPGYNLPETIFNKGKPFYLEKDPYTGKVDFETKLDMNEDELEYLDDENTDIYNKDNIDRKDGSIAGHKPNDVNQLTPNFHDFLNLPVKYNPEKYVYPLISNSYANTKIQGNVQKYHNHKDDQVTTYKPEIHLSYQPKVSYYKPNVKSTTSTTTSTTRPIGKVPEENAVPNLMFNGMKYPNSNDYTTRKIPSLQEVYQTTERIGNVYLTTKKPYVSTTTKRTLSFFEQLFGDYDEPPPTTESAPKLTTTTKQSVKFENSPSDKNNNATIVQAVKPTEKFDNILTGSAMGNENSYEYEEYEVETTSRNTVYVSKPVSFTIESPKTTSTESPSSTTKVPMKSSTENATTTVKVTSLPLGENHFEKPDSRPPIIALTTGNLKEKLDNEKIIPKPFEVMHFKPNNIHIAPDQDTISFVVGHQQNVGSSQPASNSFRPLIVEADNSQDTVSYTVQAKPEFVNPGFAPGKPLDVGGSSINLQPMKSSEASLSIGVPINGVKKIPGKVMDEKLEDDNIEFPKGTGSKVVFPDEQTQKVTQPPPLNREILQLNSKPMYHQLPSDLTPPREQEVPPTRLDRPRPPWDPRPGHFYNGRPEYSRPPRPGPNFPTKRIDNLPNILPQFRPNAKVPNVPHFYESKIHPRQPLLDRPNNKPIGFYEKLIPPPPPKNLQHIRKVPVLEQELIKQKQNEDAKKPSSDPFGFFPTPPNVLPERRQSFDPEVETLQMIQAKKSEKKDIATVNMKTTVKGKDGSDKPLYVVYPVNSAPIKLDALDSDKKEAVVVGTRAELPLPPSKISQEFPYESPIERNDSPILKPHPKPTFPTKNDFPYPLERPEISSGPSNIEAHESNQLDELKFSNQWNFDDVEAESKIVNDGPNKNNNQISATLKTYTEKPIAIAYTPTEPYRKIENTEKYSMPNYAGPVISEILPGQKGDSEITVSAVMHTHSHSHSPQSKPTLTVQYPEIHNHRIDEKVYEETPTKLDFQAPFQASVNLDKMSQGWTIVKENPSIDRSSYEEGPTLPSVPSSSEFDIENFKPQLFGGFQPIYPKAQDDTQKAEITDRQE